MSFPRTQENNQVPTVVVADASRMGCQLLAHAIQRRDRYYCRVVGSATTCEGAMSVFVKSRPTVAVVSSRLEDGRLAGLDVLQKLDTLQVRPRVITLLDEEQSEIVIESFRIGARGVFCRTGESNDLRKCIHCVYKGQIWVNNRQLEHIIGALTRSPVLNTTGALRTILSKREEEIAALVAAGLSNREVAERLLLSQHTVKNYLFRIFEKLGISTRLELVLYILSRPRAPVGENEIADLSKKISA